jgi:hypothetical protein
LQLSTFCVGSEVVALSVNQIRKLEDRLRKEIADRQSLLEAVALVREHAEGTNGSGTTRPVVVRSSDATTQATPPGPDEFGYNTKLVLWAMNGMDSEFTTSDIETFLSQHDKAITRNQIAMAFHNLEKQGKVERLRRAMGRIPAIYSKP